MSCKWPVWVGGEENLKPRMAAAGLCANLVLDTKPQFMRDIDGVLHLGAGGASDMMEDICAAMIGCHEPRARLGKCGVESLAEADVVADSNLHMHFFLFSPVL